MTSSIFSTYSTGENRVTSSILAVMRSLSLQRTERLLGALVEQSEFQLVHFLNQPSTGAKSVPDAQISGSFRILVEAKVQRNAVSKDQLLRHIGQLDGDEAMQLLLVLTPDDGQPAAVSQLEDDRVVWASFGSLDQAIDELLGDGKEVVSEREAFLLRQLQIMLVDEGLMRSANDVVVIAARNAWPEYLKVHAYICQAGRSFQPVQFMAFYSEGRIQPLIPKILEVQEQVRFEAGLHSGRLGEIVDSRLTAYGREPGGTYKVMLLSAPDAPETMKLPEPIPNDLTSQTGRPTAFTQGQRYISLSRLKTARTTSDLVGDGA